LPIGSLTKLLSEKKRTNDYNTRALKKDKEFIVQVTKLVERCYQEIFIANIDDQDSPSLSDAPNSQNESQENEEVKANNLMGIDSEFTERYCKELEVISKMSKLKSFLRMRNHLLLAKVLDFKNLKLFEQEIRSISQGE